MMFALNHRNSSTFLRLSYIPSEGAAQMGSTVEGEELSQSENHTSVQSPTKGVLVVTLFMTLGIISNIVALCILVNAYRRQRRRAKATFLLLATSLVVTDFFGHLVPGALVLCIYRGVIPKDSYYSDSLCQFLGGSMVFFGLCPLLLGCAMAAERCVGITKPLLHASLVTKTRAKICLSLIWGLALCVAILPCFKLGSYTYQNPGTWCFVNVLNNTEKVDVAFVVLFSGLCLALLVVALVCNTISGVTLVLGRFKRRPLSCRSTNSNSNSNDIEMVAQLVGIMITSCICWCPLLVSSSIKSACYFETHNTYSHLI